MTYEQTDVLERREEVEPNRPMNTADLAGREPAKPAAANRSAPGNQVPLFPENELGDLRRRWQDAQSAFVDDPRSAVRTADELVASVMTRLAQVFADERGKLEKEWDKGENVSTEDLRMALQRYRSFFERLLTV